MRPDILYVSPVWTGLADYKLADTEESGMPAFSEPLKHFISSGVHPRILWINEHSNLRLSDDYLICQSSVSISTATRFGLAISFVKVFLKTLFEIRKTKPDVVFCHGAASAGALWSSIIMRRPSVIRIYGTNKYASELARLGRMKFALKYPLVFLIFSARSDVAIATDDGSGADKIHRQIGRAKRFFFLKNGRPSVSGGSVSRGRNFICVGRIESKKNQIAALSFFESLGPEYEEAKLIFIGAVSQPDYYEELQGAINNSPARDRVKIAGVLKKKELYHAYKKADVVLSFQRDSNFSNGAIEALVFGCLLVTFVEPAFEELEQVTGSPVALLGDDLHDVLQRFRCLGLEDKNQIKRNGLMAADSALLSWTQRAKIEMEMVRGAIDG